MVIGTNMYSLYNLKNLSKTNSYIYKYSEQLSSGKRINRAGDDAAGTSVSSRFEKQIRGNKMGIRNAQDGISMIQYFEGITSTMESMLQRMRELAIQSKNGTYNNEERNLMNEEFSGLKEQVDNMITDTKYNGKTLFAAGVLMRLQVGSNANDTMNMITINLSTISNDNALAINTQSLANTAINSLSTYLDTLNEGRASLGAYQNRLEYTIDNLHTNISNTTEAKSRMTDADMAEASSELAKHKIIQQSSIALIAQSNQSNQSILQLLQ